MNCRRVVSLMSAYVDAELTGTEMLAIRRHISGCAECAEEYESVRFVKHTVSRLSVVAPRKDFAASILKKLDIVEIPPYQRAINSLAGFMHRKLSPVAAAVAAFGVAMVIFGAGGAGNNIIQPAQAPPLPVGSYKVSLVPESVDSSIIPAHFTDVRGPVLPESQPRFELLKLSH